MSPIVVSDVHRRVLDLAACRQQYMAAFGCAPFLSPTTGALTLMSDQYAAVLTSNRRGEEIAKVLHPRTVPVVAARAVWMFITARPLASDNVAAMIDTLYGHPGTLLLLPGDEIPLPTPGSDRHRWITTGDVPPFGDIVDATVRVVSKETRR
ncbi:hypothetical protein [Nocardia transvalensis]|uniref:hypothetical protein n=1 Tax=Nocardia transvalensis TaxID=37333 RepID=UPI0018957A82|nr:hypothetical protein [Nocardia transvalensis]MBF6333209.1 hypothetical protein [Nocardia transvalensis]